MMMKITAMNCALVIRNIPAQRWPQRNHFQKISNYQKILATALAIDKRNECRHAKENIIQKAVFQFNSLTTQMIFR